MSVSDVEKVMQDFSYDQYVGIQVKKMDVGDVVLELPITPSLLNYSKKVHGGVIAGLLDTVMGMTIRTLVSQPVVSVNLNISYSAPAFENEKLEAVAKILSRGRNLVMAEAEARDSQGNMVGKAIGTFKIMYRK